MKLLEGIVLLAVVVLFAWWQLRDVRKAQADSADKRAQKLSASQAAANQSKTDNKGTKDTL